MTTHLVQFSTGAGSAEVAFRVHDESTLEDRVVLLTADTMVEDEDNWRFASECVALMPNAEWVVLRDGRTPMEVGRDARVVPNNRMAVCSRVLKRELLWKHMNEHYDPNDSIVYLGFDWTEEHRWVKAEPNWHPWVVDAPLMRAPFLTKAQIIDKHRSLGIEPCRLYAQGFSHANCGGACVRGGQAQWKLLLSTNRDRYLEWEAEEERTRAYLGKDVAIMREQVQNVKYPLPLRKFRKRIEVSSEEYIKDDWGACGCFMDEETL